MCQICGVQLNSVEMYQAHMQGNKHLSRWDQITHTCRTKITPGDISLNQPGVLSVRFNVFASSQPGRRKSSTSAKPSRRSTTRLQTSCQIISRFRKLAESSQEFQLFLPKTGSWGRTVKERMWSAGQITETWAALWLTSLWTLILLTAPWLAVTVQLGDVPLHIWTRSGHPTVWITALRCL